LNFELSTLNFELLFSPKSNHSHTSRRLARNPNYSSTYAKPGGEGVKKPNPIFNKYCKCIYSTRKCRRADILDADHSGRRHFQVCGLSRQHASPGRGAGLGAQS